MQGTAETPQSITPLPPSRATYALVSPLRSSGMTLTWRTSCRMSFRRR